MTVTLPEPTGLTGPAAPPPDSRARSHEGLRRFRYLARSSVSLRIGVVLITCYFVVALASLFWTPFPADRPGVGPTYAAPDGTHWFGTDRLGSDVFSRTMAATRLDLSITVAAVLSALVIGTVVGVISGFVGGFLDGVVMRVLDMLQAFPTLLLAMITVAVLGPGTFNVIIVLAFVGLPFYLRLARAEILTKRTWQFAEAARLAGNRPMRVAFRHLLPNSTGPLLAYTSVNAAWVVLVTASLGFLGIGIEPGRAEWGAMISRGQSQITTGEWWISVFPGIAVLGLSAAFYLLGDGLRDIMDPKARR